MTTADATPIEPLSGQSVAQPARQSPSVGCCPPAASDAARAGDAKGAASGARQTGLDFSWLNFSWFTGIDRVWMVIVAIFAGLALVDPSELSGTLQFAIGALGHTAPYLIAAVGAVAYIKASGAEHVIARAFQGNEAQMIVLAALVGGLAPFCSCEVIPFIAGLLAVGTPLAAVMALWLSSPLMDPSVFLITAGELGWQFAVAKTVAAVSLGLIGGFAVLAATRQGYFSDVLLERKSSGGCCGAAKPFSGQPVWKFWQESERLAVFWREARSNAFFLLKWLALAYTIEALMVRYIPAETIASVVGGPGLWPIVISAFVGAPAYLNGLAAPALVSGLMDHGMTGGAGMAFVVAGGVTSIPAMTAVFAIVKREVFFTYLALGITGAILSGVLYSAVLAL